jgi:hypothetical protein
MEPELLLLALTLKLDIENSPENLQMELIRNAILIPTRSSLKQIVMNLIHT